MKKARRLPLSGPGIPVKVPLDCLPEYLALHGLDPIEYKNPYLIVRRHNRPWIVNRPQESKSDSG